jgi:hypothetical protein
MSEGVRDVMTILANIRTILQKNFFRRDNRKQGNYYKFMNYQEAEFERQRMRINQTELIKRVTRAVPEDELLEVFPGVILGRFSKYSKI